MADRRPVHARSALIACLIAVVAAIWVAPRVGAGLSPPTDFERELRQMDAVIAGLGPLSPDAFGDPDRATALAYRLYERAALTGRNSDFTAAQEIIGRVRMAGGRPPALSLLEATIDIRFHRLAVARQALEREPALAGSAEAEAMLGDLEVQLGLYDAAIARYREVLQRRPTWDTLVRLAAVTSRLDTDAADRLYVEAENDLTAKQMRAYAWTEVQRGALQFGRGRYAAARAHYLQADRAYSGYWLVDEHMGELLAAERKFDAAIARYEMAVARAPRPDLLQQLGDLYVFAGRAGEALRWHDQALEGYLQSVRKGEVQYLHHLAAFYADVRPDSSEAVRWAREDFELRPSSITADLLAWVLYRNGQTTEALQIIDRPLAAGLADAHLYYHGATLYRAAGRSSEAQKLVARLAELNPRYDDFHVHR